MFSESLEVGFTYPWVRPPIEVYINEITSYEGIDATYRFSMGNWINTLQVSGGSVTSPSYEISDYGGIVWTGEFGSWTTRLAITQADVTIKIPDDNIDTAATFATAATVESLAACRYGLSSPNPNRTSDPGSPLPTREARQSIPAPVAPIRRTSRPGRCRGVRSKRKVGTPRNFHLGSASLARRCSCHMHCDSCADLATRPSNRVPRTDRWGSIR